MKNDRTETARLSNSSGITLSLDANGRLVLVTPEGHRHLGVEPIRSFPIGDPSHWISFCDSEGREILCLESTDGLTPNSLALLENELALREFVPIIKQIIKVSAEGTPSEWDVETDRGPTNFTLDSDDDVRRLGPTRVLITDARKLRFQVPDTRTLDSQSRRILERYL